MGRPGAPIFGSAAGAHLSAPLLAQRHRMPPPSCLARENGTPALVCRSPRELPAKRCGFAGLLLLSSVFCLLSDPPHSVIPPSCCPLLPSSFCRSRPVPSRVPSGPCHSARRPSAACHCIPATGRPHRRRGGLWAAGWSKTAQVEQVQRAAEDGDYQIGWREEHKWTKEVSKGGVKRKGQGESRECADRRRKVP